MKEFVTAVEKREQEDLDESTDLVFTLDGQEMRAHEPTEGQFALLLMALGRHSSNTDQAGGILDFFVNVLDKPSQQYVTARMMSRENAIPIVDVITILEWFVEEWGGRPTRSPSASTPSRRSGGRKSTARTPALT